MYSLVGNKNVLVKYFMQHGWNGLIIHLTDSIKNKKYLKKDKRRSDPWDFLL